MTLHEDELPEKFWNAAPPHVVSRCDEANQNSTGPGARASRGAAEVVAPRRELMRPIVTGLVCMLRDFSNAIERLVTNEVFHEHKKGTQAFIYILCPPPSRQTSADLTEDSQLNLPLGFHLAKAERLRIGKIRGREAFQSVRFSSSNDSSKELPSANRKSDGEPLVGSNMVIGSVVTTV